ncbi:hypothetical protein EZS27_006080 [termite gut metagenome]|uniref:Caudovirus prohead protease n=1 Tax=termite gut metagenome TaxID=433724 RepID=A0A5J4SMC0_9ZZZZ
MGKRVRISNSSINCYGTRILTTGVNIEQYKRNPVMLYMHERGKVIGQIKDIQVEGDDITGEPWFDEVSEESKQYRKQWDAGSLKMVSGNFDILAISEAKEHLLPGQTRPSVISSKLMEVSIVDIGGNDDAIVLTKGEKTIKLAAGEENETLPLLKSNKKQIETEMDYKAIALKLNLPETASEQDILSSIGILLGFKTTNDTLKAERDTLKTEKETLQREVDSLKLTGITGMVEDALKAGKITQDKKEHFLTLGKTLGVDSLKLTLDAIPAAVKPLNLVGGAGGGGSTATAGDWKKLSEVPADKIMELRDTDKPAYAKLYKAEYGVDCPNY